MTQIPLQTPGSSVQPQSNIYTVLIIVAALALAATVGVSLYGLMAPSPNGYGLSFGQLFESLKEAGGR